jgi:hypothetical protein
MTRKRTAALAAFLRHCAEAKSAAAEYVEATEPAREGMRLLDVAEAAERLPTDDPRLSQLAAKRRFVTDQGDVRFVGNGNAIRDAVRSAAAGEMGEGRQALDAIIEAALRARPPRVAG